jgi:hypothetical protein
MRFDEHDPAAGDHWRECPQHPARDLLEACEALLVEVVEWNESWPDDCYISLEMWPPGSSRSYHSGRFTLGKVRKLRAAVARAEGEE